MKDIYNGTIQGEKEEYWLSVMIWLLISSVKIKFHLVFTELFISGRKNKFFFDAYHIIIPPSIKGCVTKHHTLLYCKDFD